MEKSIVGNTPIMSSDSSLFFDFNSSFRNEGKAQRSSVPAIFFSLFSGVSFVQIKGEGKGGDCVMKALLFGFLLRKGLSSMTVIGGVTDCLFLVELEIEGGSGGE